MAKKQLLLDDEDEDLIEKSSSSHQLHINTKYATQYEKRKRLEELQNSKNNVDSDSDDEDSTSSTSSEEDEDAVLSTPLLDVQILKVGIPFQSIDYISFSSNTHSFIHPYRH